METGVLFIYFFKIILVTESWGGSLRFVRIFYVCKQNSYLGVLINIKLGSIANLNNIKSYSS